ncbi:MAG: GTPase HflX [Actinomycetia bacterium]|nr:GTPase HflX [Actinomycetes bacterium]
MGSCRRSGCRHHAGWGGLGRGRRRQPRLEWASDLRRRRRGRALLTSQPPRRPEDDAPFDEPSYDDAFDELRSGDDGADSHRGGFGEFGGAVDNGLLDRSFRERIVLVGVTRAGQSTRETEASLDELAQLVDTAGADALERIVQSRERPDPATFVGRGKVSEILDASIAIDSDTVVFDDELSPAQQFNLEKILERSALDRTAVILDIFAQHATSAEGKAQVELAQLRYRLPRLRRKKNFSQQAGGIGTRGPGETQLEVDRRRLLRRMHKLERDLARITERRANQRKARRRSPFKNVCIVGYTNAGKSSLLRRLTGAEVTVEDRLFATLDPTTRRLQLPGGEQILVTDTVGFVKKLPHQLVEAFKSTLEVASLADLLIHVVDASSGDPDAHMIAVADVLREIGGSEVPQLIVFNKADLSDDGVRLVAAHPGSVLASAMTGDGIDDLLVAIGDRLRATTQLYELFIPWARGDALAAVHREGEVLDETSDESGMRLQARLEDSSASRLQEFITGSPHHRRHRPAYDGGSRPEEVL